MRIQVKEILTDSLFQNMRPTYILIVETFLARKRDFRLFWLLRQSLRWEQLCFFGWGRGFKCSSFMEEEAQKMPHFSLHQRKKIWNAWYSIVPRLADHLSSKIHHKVRYWPQWGMPYWIVGAAMLANCLGKRYVLSTGVLEGLGSRGWSMDRSLARHYSMTT